MLMQSEVSNQFAILYEDRFTHPHRPQHCEEPEFAGVALADRLCLSAQPHVNGSFEGANSHTRSRTAGGFPSVTLGSRVLTAYLFTAPSPAAVPSPAHGSSVAAHVSLLKMTDIRIASNSVTASHENDFRIRQPRCNSDGIA
ncbi:hypothetical protein CupriaWKF_05590 [Cupriavidus sp. WKF15]|uniref:hypothetical protein n=1 Tax=Cupriavidus sp. WKF15 TaxID=3032282 RepID=UPI0023E2D064|nr:hypothetical protein [Cupriavidus sp. WKF15]WER47041.1 hypothetical protein CupriaWKF_05590 [Cupriavidus sp. WKF15]